MNFPPEQLPPGQYKYEGRIVFAKYPKGEDNWCIWGPAAEIVEGKLVEAYVFSEDCMRTVEVIEIVAERTALRMDGSHVRYVMAIFDNIERSVTTEGDK